MDGETLKYSKIFEKIKMIGTVYEKSCNAYA